MKDPHIISDMCIAFIDGYHGRQCEDYAVGPGEQNGMRNVLALLMGKGWKQEEGHEKLIQMAIVELRELIDGGEECQGQDSRISHIIGILEGDANHLFTTSEGTQTKPRRLLDERALETSTVEYYNSIRPASLNDAEVLKHCKSFLCNYHKALAARKIWPEQPTETFLPSAMTLKRALVLRIISVRLGNALLRYFPEEQTNLMLDRVRARFGCPIDPVIKAEFMHLGQCGKAAMRELESLLRRIDN